eukprot:365228-Chlamydomonas_euryale.AAC.43
MKQHFTLCGSFEAKIVGPAAAYWEAADVAARSSIGGDVLGFALPAAGTGAGAGAGSGSDAHAYAPPPTPSGRRKGSPSLSRLSLAPTRRAPLGAVPPTPTAPAPLHRHSEEFGSRDSVAGGSDGGGPAETAAAPRASEARGTFYRPSMPAATLSIHQHSGKGAPHRLRASMH